MCIDFLFLCFTHAESSLCCLCYIVLVILQIRYFIAVLLLFFFFFFVNFTVLNLHKKIKILGRQYWKLFGVCSVRKCPWPWGEDCWFCAQPWAGLWIGVPLFEHQWVHFRCNKSSFAAIKRTYWIPEQPWNNSEKVMISFLNLTLKTFTFMENLHPLACRYGLP